MTSIGLCMIVKNEAHVIEACLRSVRPIVDFVLVEDTGSTDGTQDTVRRWLAAENLPGLVFDEPWQDFATNRSIALERLRQFQDIDYAFIMDADDLLVLPDGFDAEVFRQSLTHGHYFVRMRSGDHTYWRIQIVSNHAPYRYRGVVHEFIDAPDGATHGGVPGIEITHGTHGARSRNPNKYRDDALALERALQTESDPFLISRYTFYLGQSWRDAGEPVRALAAYMVRANQGYWPEEVFISLLTAARLLEALGRAADEVLTTYQRAHAAFPQRAEALHGAARYCREHGLNERGYQFVASHLPTDLATPDGLFIENRVYDYALLDEHAINAYWCGHYRECLALCCKLLGSDKLPPDQRARVAANAQSALERLSPSGAFSEIKLARSNNVAHETEPVAMPAVSASPCGGRVSIITPTENRGRLLAAAQQLVAAQSHPDIEWLILDDGDEPLKSAILSAPNIHYEHSPIKLTIGEKRNRLIDRASGEFIVHFDDDDYYAPDYVRTMVGTLVERGADLMNLRAWFLYDVRSDFFGYWDLTHKTGPHFRCDGDGVTLTVFDASMTAALADSHFGYGFSYVFRRRVWQAVPFADISWSEDSVFSKAAAQRFRFDGIHDRTGLCLHYLHAASSSRCFPQYRLPSYLAGQLFPRHRLNEPEEPRSERMPVNWRASGRPPEAPEHADEGTIFAPRSVRSERSMPPQQA